MLDKIRELERTARLLDPGPAERDQLNRQVVAYAERFLEEVPEAPTYFADSDNGRGLLDSPIAEEGIGIEEALALVRDNISSTGIGVTSGRYLGYMPSGGLFQM